MAAKTKTNSKARGKTKSAGKRGLNLGLVKALAHELRVEILAILNERMASPNELAKELNEGLSQVSYHVKVLRDYNCIELVKTEPRRGAVEHYYRASSRAFLTDRDWPQIPDTIRVGMSADLFQAVIDDAIAAMEEGKFDERTDRHLSWTPLILDEQGWADMRKTLDESLERVLEIHAESAKRLGKTGEQGFPASVSMLGYEVPLTSARKLPKRKAKSSAARTKAKSKARSK
ncbi:MAG TPA: helix-turn-helix domain-containing protein [Solirubrobacterales bacterium]|nr:helix-turn-helix domain-containing protein [Solirubrobacterales bacterium]